MCKTLYTLAIKIQCLKLVAVCDYYGDYSKSTENYLLKQMKTQVITELFLSQ